MLKKKKCLWILVVLLLLTGCSGSSSDHDQVDVSALIEKGEVELAGSTYDLHFDSVISFKYDGENVVAQSSGYQKMLSFYDGSMLSKQEIYLDDKHIVTSYFTYDDSAREIRSETVVEKTKEKTYKTTSYDKNYKEISHYDSNDALSLVSACELNDRQQIVKITSKSKEGTIESVTHYEYDGDYLVFQELTDGQSVLRETYYKYNENGDKTAYIAITYGDKYFLDAMYYDNTYDDSNLIEQSAYGAHAELSESQARDIGKSLK